MLEKRLNSPAFHAGIHGFESRTCHSYGAVVQLVRMPACHAGGRGFEPLLRRICLDSSVGRAEDWKSSCRWFDSGSRHQKRTSSEVRFLFVFLPLIPYFLINLHFIVTIITICFHSGISAIYNICEKICLTFSPYFLPPKLPKLHKIHNYRLRKSLLKS